MEHQILLGKKFYKDHESGYWICTAKKKIRAHRWVWECIHGKIPKGYHIHHKDEDKSNNCIENLLLLPASDHLRLHMTEDRRKKSSELVEKIRPMTKKWHRSEEGRLWHKYHAEKFNFGKWEPSNYTCEVCLQAYKSSKKSNSRFCSNNCKSKYRRDSGIDNVSRVCISCGNEFIANKYTKKKYCSKNCRCKK